MLLKGNGVYIKLIFAISIFLIALAPHSAMALRYGLCKAPNQSMACAVAFEKFRQIDNPLTKKKFFDDDVHIKDNKLAKIPTYYVAQPDLDHDGVPEIIAYLAPNENGKKSLFCPVKTACPHIIIQDRNPDPEKPKLRFYQNLGSIYANGIGVSTNENIAKYQSLRVYKSNTTRKFNVYQYDQKTDKYFNIGEESIDEWGRE